MRNDDALVFSAKDGLGNRLRALVGFRALAELQQVPMLLNWESDGACEANFTDLFEINGWEGVRLIGTAEAASHKASHPERYYYSSAWFTEIWQQYAQSLCSRQEFYRLAVRHLRSLCPRKELLSVVDEFAQKHRLDQCVGLHIRMTDNVHAYDWWAKNSPDFMFEKISQFDGFKIAIRDYAARGVRAFICSDNKEMAMLLSNNFPNVVMLEKKYDDQGFIHHARTHYDIPNLLSRIGVQIKHALGFRPPTTWRTTNITDALVDMLLLARCRRIIGTYYSSFSEVSALLGGIPLDRIEGTSTVENAFVLGIQELIGAERLDLASDEIR